MPDKSVSEQKTAGDVLSLLDQRTGNPD